MVGEAIEAEKILCEAGISARIINIHTIKPLDKELIIKAAKETGVIVTSDKVKLKVVAIHHHLDRREMYVAFAFLANIDSKPKLSLENEEGSSHWVEVEKAKVLENVFPPIKYYFNHVLNDKPGVIYNNSQWENTQLVRVLSETTDRNY
jgi:hypothetical protein